MPRPTIGVVDLFAGAGGTSTGVIQAAERLGLVVNLIAINHWDIAIATHRANHVNLRHLCAKVEEVNPLEVVPNGRLRLLVASPECIHHSKARGGKPRNDQSRTSAWHILRWLSALYVEQCLIENVPEFRDFGPLGANGLPLKSRKGETFQAFVDAIRSLGYKVDWRVLNCADYGAPTTRERLFIIAVRGRRQILWPEPTHSQDGAPTLFGPLKKWHTAREIIDWSVPGRSIFNRKKPLSANTMKRIFVGLEKFSGLSFVLPNEGVHRGNAPRSLDRPVPTITTRGAGALVEPFLVKFYGGHDVCSLNQPLPAVTANYEHFGLALPFILNIRGGNDGYVRGDSVDAPVPTVTGEPPLALVEPYLVKTCHGEKGRGTTRAHSLRRPMPTVTGTNDFGLAQPFLMKYNGEGGGARSVDEPVDTISTVERFGLVEPSVSSSAGETISGIPILFQDGSRGILDIRFRMLTQRELARAQSFPDDYRFLGTQKEQTKQIGNAVPPVVADALATAMLQD